MGLNQQQSQLRLSLAQQIQAVEDPELLYAIQEMLSAEQQDWWTMLSPQEKALVEKGEEDFQAGRVTEASVVIKRLKK